jgi:alkylation response protein AidB-like acyl-CoA dehydrogenase
VSPGSVSMQPSRPWLGVLERDAGSRDEPESARSLRMELRRWLEENLTEEVREAGHGIHDPANLPVLKAWNARLAEARWAAISWPEKWGGRDAGLAEQIAYQEEMAWAEAPGPVNVIGVSNIAPAIMAYGTEAQQRRYLPPLLRGEEIWSQGMSEPDAGSDLAGLRTRAVLDGEEFVVTGQKTWNSLGMWADFCQLYVRTDPDAPKREGITCLLVDMHSPGIEVRPLRTMTGEVAFADIFFDEVRVPVGSVLGEVDHGWQIAMTTLMHERAGVARLHLLLTTKLARLLQEPRAKEAMKDEALRERLCQLYEKIACMRWTSQRFLDQSCAGGSSAAGPSAMSGSLAKLAWATAEKELASLALDILGVGASQRWTTNLAWAPSASIAGGTTEINLTVLATYGLGLPR